MKGLLKSTVVRIVVLTLVVFFAALFISLRLKNNELIKQADALRAEIEEVQSDIDSLKAELDRPFDDDYVAEIAHKELGLRFPQEIVFYSGEGK